MEIWNLHKFNRLSSSGSFLPSFRCRPHIMMSGTEISHQYIATYSEQKRQSNQYIFFQSQSTGNTKRNEPTSHSSIQDDEYNNVWKSKQISSYWLPLSLNTEENLLPKWLFIDEEKEVEKLIFNFKGGNSSLLLLNRREEDGKSYHH